MEKKEAENRGSVAFFTTYRPPVALDLYSSPYNSETSTTQEQELHLTDGESYNSNGQTIPSESLKLILHKINNEFGSQFSDTEVDSGRLTGMIFVSERTNDLETLHVALRIENEPPMIFNFAELYDTCCAVRMEDSGCFAGEAKDYLVCVTTRRKRESMEDSPHRRQPWTKVYKTSLKTGNSERLTPSLQADLSPSVSPSGKKIAVASFQKRGWYGEREKLTTDIFVMNIEKPYNRKLVIKDGGWPTWGSEDVLFFHRKTGVKWGVFRADISSNDLSLVTSNTFRVTPDNIDAVTPAALDANRVAVATTHTNPGLIKFNDARKEHEYRQIEVFDYSIGQQKGVPITAHIRPLADHYNPFILHDHDGNPRIGYNRCRIKDLTSGDDVRRHFDKLQCQHEGIGLFRVSGVFPTFSSNGSKLAFVDNNFKSVWLADDKGVRKIFQKNDNTLFSPVWSQKTDTLYVCVGRPFSSRDPVNIYSIVVTDTGIELPIQLTTEFNNAFPSTNPDGTKLVFRSTRCNHGSETKYKNLYIMENLADKDSEGNITRLTNGECIDTHCKWSPTNDWIVFSSNRDIPKEARTCKEDLDSGYFSVYLVSYTKRDVVIRVMSSGSDLSGYVNHPFFSPDGKSLVVTSDVAAVSADPMSLPLFLHSARPYGDIFIVEIDPSDITKNKDKRNFKRITHTRYENATGTWTKSTSEDPFAHWNRHIKRLPTFSSAPWLSKKEKMVVASKMSSAAATLVLLFPLASVMMLGVILLLNLSSLRRRRNH